MRLALWYLFQLLFNLDRRSVLGEVSSTVLLLETLVSMARMFGASITDLTLSAGSVFVSLPLGGFFL